MSHKKYPEIIQTNRGEHKINLFQVCLTTNDQQKNHHAMSQTGNEIKPIKITNSYIKPDQPKTNKDTFKINTNSTYHARDWSHVHNKKPRISQK